MFMLVMLLSKRAVYGLHMIAVSSDACKATTTLSAHRVNYVYALVALGHG
jgi:hypothetical protein